MDKVLQLLSLLLVLCSGICLLIWASWYDSNLDFIGLSKYARQFPGGAEIGPLATLFGCLFTAWIIHPAGSDRR